MLIEDCSAVVCSSDPRGRKEEPGLLRRAVGSVVRRAAPIAGKVLGAAEAAMHSWRAVSPKGLAAGIAESLAIHLRQECTPSSVVPDPPVGERVALLVAGLRPPSENGAKLGRAACRGRGGQTV